MGYIHMIVLSGALVSAMAYLVCVIMHNITPDFISPMLYAYAEIVCCRKIVPVGKKGRQKIASDDALMSEVEDETMTDSQAVYSEQWSLFEILTPLAEKIIQDAVRLV